jgi:hypothetical protein
LYIIIQKGTTGLRRETFVFILSLTPATPSLNHIYPFVPYMSCLGRYYVRVKTFSREHKFNIFLYLFNNATSTVNIIWRRKRDGRMIIDGNLRTRRHGNTCGLFHEMSVAQMTQRRMIQ